MSAYNCTIWINSGYNAQNIPDSPARLAAATSISVPVLELNQDSFLSVVKVRTLDTRIEKTADFCRIGDFFYAVEPPIVRVGDVVTLRLLPSFTLSAIQRVGGIANLKILDGLTERVHVADDTFGLYGSDDPYMAPAFDMDVIVDTASGNFHGGSVYTFIETTLQMTGTNGMGMWFNPDASSAQYENYVDRYAITAFSDDAHDNKVTYPVASYVGPTTHTNYYMTQQLSSILPTPSGQVLYWTNSGNSGPDEQVFRGRIAAFSLGIENSISGSFEIPSSMIEQPSVPTGGNMVLSLTGKLTSTDTTIPYKYYTATYTAKNNRVYYGNYTKFTLASAAGNTVSANAEEIYDSNKACPEIIGRCDPRREGCPYYRFKWMNGRSGVADEIDFFRNAVAGTTWRNVPLVFTGKSGSLLDRMSFEAQIAQENLDKKWSEKSAVYRTVGGAVNMAANLGMGVVTGNPKQILEGFSAGYTLLQDMNSYQEYMEKMNLKRSIEEERFGISQSVNVPTINFPLKPELMSDLLGNGFTLARVVYKVEDIKRIDKILNAYGYRHTKMLENSDFTNRTKFNYVRGWISIGDLPAWWADGIAAELSSGVRVWHTTPTPSAYLDNPIAT